MPKAASKNPAYPDADPTAPGGMSRKDLGQELVSKHGWSVSEVKDEFGALSSWPEMIDAVIRERAQREREAKEAARELLAEDDTAYDENEDAGFDAPHPDEAGTDLSPADDDIISEYDAILAGFTGLGGASEDEVPLSEGSPLFIGMPYNKDYIFDGHAGAGPSGSERWMNCTASLGASRAFLETLTANQQEVFAKANTAAQQGTTAHAVAEAEAKVMLGEKSEAELAVVLTTLTEGQDAGTEYDEEMAEYVQEYLDWLADHHRDGHEVRVEQRVSAVIPLMTVDADGEQDMHIITGSADAVILPTEDENVLTVGDLKYGEGKDVDAVDNSQAKIYALGVLGDLADEEGNLPDIERIDIVIIQPRLGGIKTWSTTIDELLDWRDDELSPALTFALAGIKGGASFNPGEVQCQWCPARGGCAALAEQRINNASELFDSIVEAEYEHGPGAFPETALMNDEQLGSMYSQLRGLLDLLPDIKAEAERRLHRGSKIPGYKLVNYSPPREWVESTTDEDIEALFDTAAEAYKPQARISPTQAIKALAAYYEGGTIKAREEAAEKVIAGLFVKPEKRPVIGTQDDRRSAWEGGAPEQMFPDLDEEERA